MRISSIAGILVALLFSSAAIAQSFEEVLSEAQNQVGDMQKYQKALQDPDQRLQYALVQQMLKLKDPALQRIAKEHALFSTNPVMRELAIKAILDSGATLRIQLTGDRASVPYITEWVANNGGTYLDNQGQVLLKVNDALTEDCWGYRDTCVFRLVGNSVQLTPPFPNRRTLSSVLDLGNDGILRGSMSYANSEFVGIQIDLKE